MGHNASFTPTCVCMMRAENLRILEVFGDIFMCILFGQNLKFLNGNHSIK